jgi:RNA polymerase sigma factor (sigma-70 family)
MINATLDPSSKLRRGIAVVGDPADGPADGPGHAPQQEAAAGMIVRHWATVRRYLRVLGADSAMADDLAQDVFVVALRKGIEDRGGQTAAWLRRTARNLFLDNSRKRHPVSLEVADEVWEEHCDDEGERRGALQSCLKLLTERSQAAVRLAYGDRQSWAQIGSTLGMQASGVKTLLRRCRETLRQCIEKSTANGAEVSQ